MPIDEFEYLLWKKYVGLKTRFSEAFELDTDRSK